MYDCDVECVKNVPSDSLQTYNPEYEGCQIFQIFDTVNYKDNLLRLRDNLGEFLKNRNSGLFAIWTLRNQDRLNETLITDLCDRAQLLDTRCFFASIGEICC